MTRTSTLYRFFGADGSLLYVGLTTNPARRLEKHRGTKSWWDSVARVELEQYPDLASLRRAERDAIKAEQPRYNIRMNGGGDPAGSAPTATDEEFCEGLVGRHFHSWRPRCDDDSEYATVRGDNVLEWQGHVVDEVADGVYLVDLYSWWDGFPGDQRIVRIEHMSLWTFYDSALEMQIGLGCPESDPHRCGGPVTHYFDHRRDGLGLHLLCYSCVKRYPGFRDASEFKWVNGKPVL